MKLEMDIHVLATPERAFSFATDFPSHARAISAITKMEVLTEGPVGVGTRFRETRKMFGKEATEEMEIIRFDPPRSYEFKAESNGARYLSTFCFTPEGKGTRVALEFVATPLTFTAKLMKPLGVLMKGVMRKAMRRDLEEIKIHLETEKPGATEAAG